MGIGGALLRHTTERYSEPEQLSSHPQKEFNMSDASTEVHSFFKSIRIALAVSGAVALLAGIILLVWPVKSAIVLTIIIAIYLVIAGIVYIGLGIFSGKKGGWARVGHIVLGLLYIIAGVIGFINPAQTALIFALVTVIFIGVSWIVDGIVSLTLLGKDGSRVWTLLYALLSIVAGILLISMGMSGVAIMWMIIAISLVAMGIVQIIRAITLGKDEAEFTSGVSSATVA